MSSLALAASAPTYGRHRPEQTVLYAVISEHYPRFLQSIEASGGHLPAFVRQEFEDYLKCGLLEHGFLRGSSVMGAATSTWWRSAVSVADSVLAAALGAWWSPPRTWSITCFRRYQSGSAGESGWAICPQGKKRNHEAVARGC